MEKYIATIAALAISVSALSQNVNPTVQVTNDYQTHMSEVRKQGVEISVPDTLYDIDYNFDYSVFESPYKGAYEFTPYAVKMEPAVTPSSSSKFFLRAGAGYTLHPEAELDWTPVTGGKFSLGVFGTGSGFLGKYAVLDNDAMPVTGRFDGYDFGDKAGLQGSWRYGKGDLSFELGHNGAFASGSIYSGMSEGSSSAYNAFYGKLRAKSLDAGNRKFIYDAGVSYRYGMDGFKYGSVSGQNLGITDKSLTADVSVGPVIAGKYRILIDAGLEIDNWSGAYSGTFNFITMKPHVDFLLGPVRIDAGVRIDHLDKFIFRPDVRAEFSIGQRRPFTIYADVTGGNYMNTYHGFKMSNHRFNAQYGEISASTEKIKGKLGFRGYISNRFQFDLNGGYGMFAGCPLDCLDAQLEYDGSMYYREKIGYADYNMIFGDAKLSWRSERFDALAGISVRRLMNVVVPQEDQESGAPVYGDFSTMFALPLVSGDIQLRYNFARRLFFGVNVSGETSRKSVAGDSMSVPGFVDLGVSAEYKFSPGFSFWAKGGNLLCQPVRKSLMYVDRLPFGTVGIALCL